MYIEIEKSKDFFFEVVVTIGKRLKDSLKLQTCLLRSFSNRLTWRVLGAKHYPRSWSLVAGSI